ncbi:MAG TPA: LysR family transcriptional regulator [Candidatus Angelobacter sp.]|nr:LysR family transcriptional regulator [Candidatus Angelobacter sp.]
MDLFQLETFLAVAQSGSFSGAAKVVHRTQPAVSQVVRKLEEELGEPLFDRSSRDGRLTDAGKVLQEYALKMLNLRREARASIEELRQFQRGTLVLAANEFTSLYLLRVLEEFRKFSPMIKVAVQRGLASGIAAQVADHSVELGVLSFRPENPLLQSIVVFRDELVLVVPPSHPLAGSRTVSIRQLGAESFVAHNVVSPYRLKVLEAFKRHKTPLNMDVEMPTIEAIKRFVASGNGVALVPRISVEPELARGELVSIPVKELQFERKLRIIYRKGGTLSHAARAFLKVAQSMAVTAQGRCLYQPER